MIRTFVDSDVLINAARGLEPFSTPAMIVLSDTNRRFVSSNFVCLEVIPKAKFFGRDTEYKFYQSYFEAVEEWVSPSPELINSALQIATQFGLSGMDALHIASAQMADIEEFVTAERPFSPLFRVPFFKMVSLHENR